jgi:hypothetical protein
LAFNPRKDKALHPLIRGALDARMKTKSRSKEFVRIRTLSTKGFADAARTFKMTQQHLAFCILSYFGEHPERLRLVSRDPADARKGKQ